MSDLHPQWDSSTNAGFSSGVPWMHVNEDYETWNASCQLEDEGSVFIVLQTRSSDRKQYPVLVRSRVVSIVNKL